MLKSVGNSLKSLKSKFSVEIHYCPTVPWRAKRFLPPKKREPPENGRNPIHGTSKRRVYVPQKLLIEDKCLSSNFKRAFPQMLLSNTMVDTYGTNYPINWKLSYTLQWFVSSPWITMINICWLLVFFYNKKKHKISWKNVFFPSARRYVINVGFL